MGEAYGDSVPAPEHHGRGHVRNTSIRTSGIVHESQDQFGVFSRLSAVEPKQVSGRREKSQAAIHEGLRRTHSQPSRVPVVVEIPVDFFHRDEAEVEMLAAPRPIRPPQPETPPTSSACRPSILAEAERPLIWAGGGVTISSGAWDGAADRSPNRLDISRNAHHLQRQGLDPRRPSAGPSATWPTSTDPIKPPDGASPTPCSR